jgi:glycosyltransferase involved in cell wall biosynthesis
MISIAMATYNGEKYLREQIDSILRQTYKDFEVIICDDCSTDSTWSILQKYEDIDTRIHCYLNEINVGFRKNFEKAILLCRGEYIALSDQDDIWTDNHLELLDKYKDSCILIYSKAELLSCDGIRTGKLAHIYSRLSDESHLLYSLFFYNPIQGCTMMFHNSLVDKALPIPDQIYYHDYWLAIIAVMSNNVCFVDDLTVLYRQHGNNVSKQSGSRRKRYRDTLLMQYITLDIFLIKFGTKLTVEQNKICTSIHLYQRWTLDKTNMIKRIHFFLVYYRILYRDKYILKFIPRIIFNIFLVSKGKV